ncbi:MAG: AMP-binding protein [Betaproteobacteria bacterium]|nr:AMP-binding protein [Betaproteobacteria bacterium]
MTPRSPLLHGYLIDSARRLPDKVALVCERMRVTYAQLDRQSDALARALAGRGVKRGDRVAVFGENSVETVVSFWAVLKANAVVSLINPRTKAEKLAYCLDDLRAAALIAEAHLADVFVPAIARAKRPATVIVSGELDPARAKELTGCTTFAEALGAMPGDCAVACTSIDIDLAAIIYTSGSMGEAKGVMLTHRNMLTAATSINAYLGNVEDDVILGALPLAFDYGLYQMILAFAVGARLVLERSFALLPRVVARMEKEGVSAFPCLPTVCALLAEMPTLARFDLSRIRYVTVSGAALPQKHLALLKRVFPAARIFSMFGLTECKRCTYLPPEDLDRKPGSVGIAIPDTELWLVDENDREVGPHQVGQLVIRGATVMQGYWGDPELTATRLRPGKLPGERVLYTGDLCTRDEEGYLYFVARMDDIIKSRGEKIAPREVEAALMDIPEVKEVAVIGVPDEIQGQAIKAFVVIDQGASLSETQVLAECRRRLAAVMVPRYVRFVTGLPKTPTGKIDKSGLS